MFGTALRLLAVGEAGQRMGVYVRNLTTKYGTPAERKAGYPLVSQTSSATVLHSASATAARMPRVIVKATASNMPSSSSRSYSAGRGFWLAGIAQGIDLV